LPITNKNTTRRNSLIPENWNVRSHKHLLANDVNKATRHETQGQGYAKQHHCLQCQQFWPQAQCQGI